MLDSEGAALFNILSIIIYVLVSLILTVGVLYYFTKHKRLQWYTYATLGLTYWIGFSSIFLITIDIATALYEKPTSEGVYRFLYILWQIVYWSIQFLAWFLIPYVQVYVEQGHFTIFRRIAFACIENFVLYILFFVLVGAVGVGILIWIIVKSSQEGADLKELFLKGIPALCLQASNIFGLLLLIGFLGYGVVAFPRWLWYKANHARRLKYLQFKTSNVTNHLEEIEEDFSIIKAQLEELDRDLPNEEAVGKQLTLRRCVDKMLHKYETIPNLSKIKASKLNDIKPIKKSYWALVKLNRRIVQDLRKLNQKHHEIKVTEEEAFFLQDVISARKNPSRNYIHSFINPLPKKLDRRFMQRLRYIWWCFIMPWTFRFLALVASIFGAVLLWCEVSQTISNIIGRPDINLSPYSHLVRVFKFSRLLTQLSSFCIVFYIMIVVYFGMFELKVFKYYSLIPGHSDAPSLLYSTVFLTRLIPALLYNFIILLQVKNSGSAHDNVAFFAVMGSLNLDKLVIIGEIGQRFADYFPLLIIVVALITFIAYIGLRFLSFLMNDIFIYVFHPTKSKSAIDDGERMLRSARRRWFRERDIEDILIDDLPDGNGDDDFIDSDVSMESLGSDSDDFATLESRRNSKKKKKKNRKKNVRTEVVNGMSFKVITHDEDDFLSDEEDDETKRKAQQDRLNRLFEKHGKTRASARRSRF